PTALEARGLEVSTVAEAIRKAATLAPVGLLAANGEQYLGLADARPADLDALEALPIPVEGSTPVRLSVLGHARLEPARELTRYVAGSGDAVLINLMRRPSASAIGLSDAAHAWFHDHRALLPPDVRIDTFYDQSLLVRSSVANVRDSLLAGAVMAVAIVLLFLRSKRLGLAAALVLPASIALTLCGSAACGQPLNR